MDSKNRLRPVPLTRRLSEKYGGAWYYDPRDHVWYASDGIRYVCRVLTGKDMEGEYTGETSLCLYYRDERAPEWVYL